MRKWPNQDAPMFCENNNTCVVPLLVLVVSNYFTCRGAGSRNAQEETDSQIETANHRRIPTPTWLDRLNEGCLSSGYLSSD